MEEGKGSRKTPRSGLQGSFVTGAIALVFLIIGYETALFVHKAATLRIEAHRDHPDTVYVIDSALAAALLDIELPVGDEGFPEGASTLFSATEGNPSPSSTKPLPSRASTFSFSTEGVPSSTKSRPIIIRKSAAHSPAVEQVRAARRPVESFRFNPNTVSLEDLQRLGFSARQAQAIDNYRAKGGRFRRPEDFARSYVVADSVFARLKPFIDIPKLNLNQADSVALLDLPGIGPWYAGAIVRYRQRLRGFSTSRQLLEIYRFDEEKYQGLADLIVCPAPAPYPLWTLPEAELAEHPYLSRAEAHGVVLYREHHPAEQCTLEGLKQAGVLSEEHAGKWDQCVIASP